MEMMRKIEGNHLKRKRRIKAKSAARVMTLMTSISLTTFISETSYQGAILMIRQKTRIRFISTNKSRQKVDMEDHKE